MDFQGSRLRAWVRTPDTLSTGVDVTLFKDGKSNVTLEWENFTTYQTFLKPDIRAADLHAEFTIGGSQNIFGFSGIISYFEYNRLSNKNLQNPIPKDVTEFENKYSKITKQVMSFLIGRGKSNFDWPRAPMSQHQFANQ